MPYKFDSIIGLLAFVTLFIPIPTVKIGVSIMLLLFFAVRQDKLLVGIYLMLFFPQVIGYINLLTTIGVTGMHSFILGLLIVIFKLKLYKEDLKYLKKAALIYFIIAIIIFIGFWYGPRFDYSYEKLYSFAIIGMIKIPVIYLLFSRTVDWQRLGIMIILGMIVYVNFVTGIDLNQNLPVSFGSLKGFKEANFLGHAIGMVPLLGAAFLLSKANEKSIASEKIRMIIFIIIVCFLIFISGARQALFGALLLYFVINLFVKNKKNFVVPIIITIVFALIIEFLAASGNEYISKIVQADSFEETINRGREIDHTLDIINTVPYFGKGLGGFLENYENYMVTRDVTRWYPHNLILEIITELGFVGFFTIFIIFLITINFRYLIKFQSENGYYLIPVFFVLFLRSMISGDLIESHIIFSFLFAYQAYYKKTHSFEYKSQPYALQ